MVLDPFLALLMSSFPAWDRSAKRDEASFPEVLDRLVEWLGSPQGLDLDVGRIVGQSGADPEVCTTGHLADDLAGTDEVSESFEDCVERDDTDALRNGIAALQARQVAPATH